MRKIQILGSGAGDFYRKDFKGDSYYKEAIEMGGANIRRASSCLLSPDILIDFYSDEGLRNSRISPESIRHLLITHGHFDHFNPKGIVEFASSLPRKLKLYGNSAIKDAIEFAAQHKWDVRQERLVARDNPLEIDFIPVNINKSFYIDDVKITPLQANHMVDMQHLLINQKALNYIFEYGARTILYALDSSWFLPETIEILESFKFDICILDGTFGYLELDPFKSGHLNFKMLNETVNQMRQIGAVTDNTKIISSHISMTAVEPHDSIKNKVSKQGFILAYDGMIL